TIQSDGSCVAVKYRAMPNPNATGSHGISRPGAHSAISHTLIWRKAPSILSNQGQTRRCRTRAAAPVGQAAALPALHSTIARRPTSRYGCYTSSTPACITLRERTPGCGKALSAAHFGPGVAQAYRAVENGRAGLGVRIAKEIPLPLKL